MTDRDLAIQTEEIQNDGKDTFHFHRYEPTPYAVLERLFDAFTPSSSDVLVDYGCGLGRLNFYLEHRFHIPSVGIEMSEAYYRRAISNLQSYNGNRENISFLHMSAENYTVTPEDTLFYFFNPFSTQIFRRVLSHILLSWQNHPRKITLLLYYPEDDVIFYLERHTAFSLVDEIAACDDIRADRRERFCLFRLS
ncbi:MAG: class I SAM-dependent methyltransferase [Lachnospiraceae bacterium]|nr:class I SAM-dependent methyltransferase [Lachnospiraceae bacterium]